MKNQILIVAILFIPLMSLVLFPGLALAACTKIDGPKKIPYTGTSLSGYQVEKASLVELNKSFPAMNILEKAFKGELMTCSNCKEKYITCK